GNLSTADAAYLSPKGCPPVDIVYPNPYSLHNDCSPAVIQDLSVYGIHPSLPYTRQDTKQFPPPQTKLSEHLIHSVALALTKKTLYDATFYMEHLHAYW